VPLAVIYGILVVSSLAAPGGLDIFTSGSAVTLATLSKAFAEPGTMAAGWAHYVCFDLFVGRWVWADGLRNKVVTAHSLVLGEWFIFGASHSWAALSTEGGADSTVRSAESRVQGAGSKVEGAESRVAGEESRVGGGELRVGGGG